MGNTQKPCQIAVVPMAAEHLTRLAEIETECFALPWSFASLAEELTNPLAVFLVALCGGEVAGYVGMTQVMGEGYIANLAVAGAMRRRGVATALLRHLVAHAQRGELDFLTLEVRRSNAAAQALYARFGFVPVGERPRFYENPTENAVIMTLHHP